ncbi:hypothetical protein RND61_08070 [Streptomyces sp. TRM76323]|uniref:PRC-barrel domain-containing protein n=1 Tax=Streptomyces tamarix TaxID=3078565 RepID=A0ABU3QGY6_9ACTN|nr:hypothetical protein [Streptomyces tamarix]MDT9682030.1 hypothetical protein [Streptomyces tamarix]
MSSADGGTTGTAGDAAAHASGDADRTPDTGAYVIDARDGRVGQVMGHVGGYVQLRPPGGGREWDCPPDAVAPAAPDVVLRARVRELNRASLR